MWGPLVRQSSLLSGRRTEGLRARGSKEDILVLEPDVCAHCCVYVCGLPVTYSGRKIYGTHTHTHTHFLWLLFLSSPYPPPYV